MNSPPAIDVTSHSSGSKIGLYGSRANQLALLDSLKSARVINTKLTPLRHKFRTGMFAGSIIGNPKSKFDLSSSDETKLWEATAIRWALWESRQHWKSLYSGLPKSQRSDRDLMRYATRTALNLTFDRELIEDEHVDSFMPDFTATPKDLKRLLQASKEGEGWVLNIWDGEHDLSPSIKQKVLEEKSGVKVRQWMPWGWSYCSNTQDLRNLMSVYAPPPAPVSSDGESEKQQLLPS